MGRGLSKLQEFIIVEANKLNRCYYADLLEKYYGWKPSRPIERFNTTYTETVSGVKRELLTPKELLGQIKEPGSHYFSPKQVGEEEYNKVMASLSRACLRLQDRGLVNCINGSDTQFAAVELTSLGRFEAKWIKDRELAKVFAKEEGFKFRIRGKRYTLKRVP